MKRNIIIVLLFYSFYSYAQNKVPIVIPLQNEVAPTFGYLTFTDTICFDTLVGIVITDIFFKEAISLSASNEIDSIYVSRMKIYCKKRNICKINVNYDFVNNNYTNNLILRYIDIFKNIYKYQPYSQYRSKRVIQENFIRFILHFIIIYNKKKVSPVFKKLD